MTPTVWTEEIRIPSFDVTTPQGPASVLALADYCQEASGRHAEALGVSIQDFLAEGKAWVLARLRLEIDRLPRWGEVIEIETWPAGLEGAFAHRAFVFRDSEDALLARGSSRWLLIDVERRHPLRPPPILYDIDTPDRSSPLDDDPSDLTGPSHVDWDRTITVRHHDLDLNQHVNNVRYLEWAVETLPAEDFNGRRCRALDLQFEAEATLQESIRATAELCPDEDGCSVRHRLAHADTDRTLALARTEWAAPATDSPPS